MLIAWYGRLIQNETEQGHVYDQIWIINWEDTLEIMNLLMYEKISHIRRSVRLSSLNNWNEQISEPKDP